MGKPQEMMLSDWVQVSITRGLFLSAENHFPETVPICLSIVNAFICS